MKRKPPADNIVCRNRDAAHRYEILQAVDCGMVLLGTEVKSLRDRVASLEEAYARIDGGELWLVDCHIAPYRFGHTSNHESKRRRKLLVHAHELRKLKPMVERRGLTLIPLCIYFTPRGLAKVTIALARGKKTADKRQALRSRDHQREIQRAMRRRTR
ncbi:MAG: SsrA-binding protein SmpB [Phycisphaerae bacterium]